MYEKDGIEFPRCTHIIGDCTDKSNGLVQWSANEACRWIRDNVTQTWPLDANQLSHYLVTEHHLEQARYAYKDTSQIALDVGSEVHAAIEDYLKGKPVTLTSEQATNAFEAFLGWEKDVDLKPRALEKTVWGERWAGTLDFLGYYKGKRYINDWKTSKAFYPEMRYQVAAYRNAVESELYCDQENPDLTPEGCGVLMLDKTTGMPKFKDTSKTYEQDLKVFNAMVDLFYLRHPRIASRFNEEKHDRNK